MIDAVENSAGTEGFITKAEVARRLKKELRTVTRWMRRGLIPYYKVGRCVLFKWPEVESHLGETCRVCRHGAKGVAR